MTDTTNPELAALVIAVGDAVSAAGNLRDAAGRHPDLADAVTRFNDAFAAVVAHTNKLAEEGR